MWTDWLMSLVTPSPPGKGSAVGLKKKHSMMDSSTSASTPATALSLVEETSSFFQYCCNGDSASDEAVSLQEDQSWVDDVDDDIADEEDDIREPRPRRSSRRSKRSKQAAAPFGANACLPQCQDPRDAERAERKKRVIVPPASIGVYCPTKSWPDGTLQIIWQQQERNVHGLNGVDRFRAHLELTLDDLSTIEIDASLSGDGAFHDSISSKYSGMSIELHPDETTIHKIGSITCYRLRPPALKLDQMDIPADCPQQLSDLLYQLPQAGMFKSWGSNQKTNGSKNRKKRSNSKKRLPIGGEEGNTEPESISDLDDDDQDVDDVYYRHHWHPSSSTVSSYLWIQDITIAKDYRGIGLGYCLMEDACKRVADQFSWLLVAPPAPILQDYFGLFGFEALQGSTEFWARWNASPSNPRLDEVLPSVPYTTQQSKDQGFQL
mmetsp:Transcript_34742/g.72318  ORF Transcript_34742/g.72318 Transcript_34742/m.72318 type:complete len:435 (-) Transcript_34742:366-1670(-)